MLNCNPKSYTLNPIEKGSKIGPLYKLHLPYHWHNTFWVEELVMDQK